MTVVAVAGGKGSPGATTLAMALSVAARARSTGETLIIEADPAGGDIAARCGLTLDPGLLTLAASARRGLDRSTVHAHLQALPNGALALVGPTSDPQAASALAQIGGALNSLVDTSARLVVIDAGRWHAGSAAAELVRTASCVALVLRPTIEGVAHAQSQLETLAQHAARIVPVSIGARPYPPADVSAALGVDDVCVVGHEPRAAAIVATGARPDRWLLRSALLRSAAALLADRLLEPDDAAVTQ